MTDSSQQSMMQPGRWPIFLSVFFPGTGQLFQKRWLAAILVAGGFIVCVGMVLSHALRPIWMYYNILDVPEEVLEDGAYLKGVIRGILTWFGISMIVYFAGIIDTYAAFRRALSAAVREEIRKKRESLDKPREDAAG